MTQGRSFHDYVITPNHSLKFYSANLKNMRLCFGQTIRTFPLLLAAGSFPTMAAQSVQQISPAAIYERSHSSVVVVIVLDDDSKPIGQGSGFIVAKNRFVTNHHVVEGAAGALVVFADGKSEPAEGIANDSPARDLALLAVKTGPRFALKLGDELKVKQGDSVYALGAPRGLELSLTNGIVSGFRDVDGQFLIQTTAAIAPGSSGGPLFDSSGRVIGVTTSSLTDSPGIYFSVAAGDVSRLLRAPRIILPFSPKESEPRPRSPAPSAAPSNPSSPDSETGAVLIITRPAGADIFINGRKQPGQTPTELHLAVGQYNLVLRLDGYEPYSANVQVAKYATRLEVGLKERRTSETASVEVTSSPKGAEILIDGTSTGLVTPARVQVRPGLHTLLLRLDGYEPAERTLQISQGGTLIVNQTLSPK
jgi:S1-C subfamily serine protease